MGGAGEATVTGGKATDLGWTCGATVVAGSWAGRGEEGGTEPAWQGGGRLWAGGPGVKGRPPPPLFPERGWPRAGGRSQAEEERGRGGLWERLRGARAGGGQEG